MNIVRLPLLAILLLVPVSGYAANAKSAMDQHPKWFTCENNEDCTTIITSGGHCVGENKEYERDLTSYLAEKGKVATEPQPCHEQGHFIACQQTQCMITKRRSD